MTITEQKTYQSLIARFIEENTLLCQLEGKTLLLTGATGMIGSFLVDVLMTRNECLPAAQQTTVIAMGRNKERARERFAYCWEKPFFSFVAHDISNSLEGILNEPVSYVIHAASNADPVSFARYPADTLLANVFGTKNLVDYGMTHGMRRFLYVSSGEMYGQPDTNMADFVETYCGPLNFESARTCYPEGKRAAETLCQCYIAQYGIDAVIVRPCHIFGPTMTNSDSRAVSEFFRKAIAGESVVLKSSGMLERSQCYVADAVDAMLYVLFMGANGQAYNISDKKYQMTIREFAQRVADAASVQCCFADSTDVEAAGYSTVERAVLSADKLREIGWQPHYGIKDGIAETIDILRDIHGVGTFL